MIVKTMVTYLITIKSLNKKKQIYEGDRKILTLNRISNKGSLHSKGVALSSVYIAELYNNNTYFPYDYYKKNDISIYGSKNLCSRNYNFRLISMLFFFKRCRKKYLFAVIVLIMNVPFSAL